MGNPKAAPFLFPQPYPVRKRGDSERKAHIDNPFPLWEPIEVRVISRGTIREFAAQHPDALHPLLHWAKAAEASSWQTPADLRSTFNSADFVEDLTVFNIGGNKYRLIAFVQYQREIVYIKAVLTHKDYDKGTWKR